MLRINDTISIEDWEITEQFIRASGPGGQNVNKVSSAVELRFAAAHSPNLPGPVQPRLSGYRARAFGQVDPNRADPSETAYRNQTDDGVQETQAQGQEGTRRGEGIAWESRS